MPTLAFRPPPRRRLAVHPSPFTPILTRKLERIEADVFAEIYRAATPEEVRALGLRVERVGPASVFITAKADVLALNRALNLGMGAPATEADLDALCARFEAAGVPRFFVAVSPAAAPPTLYDWLAARGLRHYNNWVKLFRLTDNPPSAPTDLRIERIEPEHAATYARLITPAFDWPEALQGPLARTVGRAGWHHYLAFDGDEPVAAAALFVRGDVAYLGPAATQASHRGRGAQSAFIARRLRDAAALGATLAVTETAAERPDRPVVPSYRNMRRLGFEVAYHRPNYLGSRSA